MPVDIDWSIVEQVEDLDKPFKKALARAEDSEEQGIRLEWAEAKSEFYQRRSATAALGLAKREALDKYPLAKEFADDIKGSTPSEIEAVAKRFHERMEKVTADAAKAKEDAERATEEAQGLARQQYGAPAAGGGGSPARPANQLSEREEAIQRVHEKLRRGEGLQRGGDKMDVITMGNERLRQAIDFQREPHPELGLGTGGSYRGEATKDRKLVDARVEARKAARRQ